MRLFKYFAVFATVSLIAVGAFLFTQFGKTEAEKHEFWITIDENELKVVLDDAKRRGVDLGLQVKNVQNGIAVVYASNGNLERLSSKMHDHFDKCSGFIAHQTEADALNTISDSFSNVGNQKFVDYTIDNTANVAPLITQAEELRVRQMIINLSGQFATRRHDQPSGLLSAQFIKDTWTTLANGRDDITVEFFNHPTNVTPQPSVILTIQGTTLPNEIVVLGGHQDSIVSGSSTGTAPGADDDASGIASLTEVIRVISESNFRPERTVKFMAYAAEEVGLRGSNDIATNFRNNNANVVGVLQLDMTNYKGSPTADFAFESDSRFSNVPQTDFMKSLVTTYLPTLTYTNSACNYGCSDHASWHNKGYPASFPFEAPFGQHNNQIHTGNDTIARSSNNANHAVKFSKLGIAYVGELAKGMIPPAVPENRTKFDFDGDHKTDVSIFRPSVGEWWYLRSTNNSNFAVQFGNSTDKPIPADYTGDGKTDFAFWRESTQEIYAIRSEDLTFYAFPFGAAGDIPAPGDFDGDGTDDVAVFRPSQGVWYITRSTDNQTIFVNFGTNGDQPVVADFDGDGMDDVAIYRPTVSEWWINKSSGGVSAVQFGQSGDQTAQGDWTGDGKADIAFWRPTTGEWFVIRSEDLSFFAFPFGLTGDIPVSGDYDGDGRIDAAVFRPSDNVWYRSQSTNGVDFVGFGVNGDYPVPNSYVAE